MRLCVDLVGVSVWEALATFLTLQWNIGGVQLLNVDFQVSLSAASSGAKFALVDRFSSTVYQSMSFKRITLCEPGMANYTFVWLLSGVDAKMSLEFVGVGRGIRAMRTLVRPLPSVAPHMPLKL